MVFVSATRLRLRSPIYLPFFYWHALPTQWQIAKTPGFLGGKLLADNNLAYWTITVWQDEAAMKILRDKGAHKKVMPQLHNWCDEAVLAHWYQETNKIPSFAEVHQRMMAQGFFTRLPHASASQLQRYIPAPSTSNRVPTALHPKLTLGNS